LFAATSPLAKAGGYYGPNQLGETRGFPAVARVPALAADEAAAARLWNLSETLTGITFPSMAIKQEVSVPDSRDCAD
jgi:hypothetical protein